MSVLDDVCATMHATGGGADQTLLQKLFFKYIFRGAEDEDKGAGARRERKLARYNKRKSLMKGVGRS